MTTTEHPSDSPLHSWEDWGRLFKWKAGLLAAFHTLITKAGAARLDSRLIRNLIFQKGYIAELKRYGIVQDPDRSYRPSCFRKGPGQAIYYFLDPTRIDQIEGAFGEVVRFFIKQEEGTREAILKRCKRSELRWAFMPEMRKLGEENGISMRRISKKHENYYSGASATKLDQWKPGVVEIDVHAMNFFSLGELCAPGERHRYLSLFQGRGFYQNLKCLSGHHELEMADFKKHLLASLNKRRPARLVRLDPDQLEQRNARFRDKARKQRLRKLSIPRSPKEKVALAARALSKSLGLTSVSNSEVWQPYVPPEQDHSPAFTFLAKEFPGLWRAFCDLSKKLGPSRLSTEFFLPHQAFLCGKPCRILEGKGVGVCQRNDAVVSRIQDAPELASTMRELAQEHFEAQPVLTARFSPGTSTEDKERFKMLRPDLFRSDSDETLNLEDYWPDFSSHI